MKKKTDVFTVATIMKMVKIAREHRIEPVRYASTDVIKIKKGTFKDFYYVRKGAKPRKNGKYSFYGIVYRKKKLKPEIFVYS